MIAHDVSVKNKKSAKVSLVQIPVVKESEESESKEYEDSDAEKAGTDSPSEELENRKNISSEDEASSGADGDASDSNEDEANDVSYKLHQANPHWADAMKKILCTKKPKRKKSIVLSKAKKINDIVAKPKEVTVSFEIQSKEGEIKKETVKVPEKITIESENNLNQKEQRRKNFGKKIRTKPSVLDREYERRLQKIATNGVVQLFNAVRQQQKEIEEKLSEAGPLERKREKALKNINRKMFLDVLMGGTSSLDNPEELKNEDQQKNENDVWGVLRDDFVMGAKMKDWNKNNSSDESSAPAEEMDSD